MAMRANFKKPQLKHRLLITVVCLLVLVCGHAARDGHAEPAFQVDGVCDFQQLNQTGRVLEARSAQFDLAVDASRYTLKLVVQGEPEDYQQVAGDETNTYYLMVMKTAVERLRQAGQKVGENEAGGTVLRRPVPNLGSSSPAGPLWLAFASAWYFARLDNGARAAGVGRAEVDLASGLATDGGMDIEQFRVKRLATWQVLEPKGLPREVVYFEPGFALRPTAPRGMFTKVPFPVPYSNGFTNSCFVVLQATNFAGVAVPQEAVFTTYWMKSHGSSSNDLWPRYVFKIHARHFSTLTHSVTLPPPLPVKTLIADARFVEDPKMPKASWSYIAEGTFPTDEQVRRSAAYKAAKPQIQPAVASARPGSGRAVKATVIAVLAASCLLPIMLYVRRLWMHNKAKKNQP